MVAILVKSRVRWARSFVPTRPFALDGCIEGIEYDWRCPRGHKKHVHPTWLHAHFKAFIPIGRAINPISQTNWEGTGVKPDVPVPEENALLVAQMHALRKLLDTETHAQRRELIAARLTELTR